MRVSTGSNVLRAQHIDQSSIIKTNDESAFNTNLNFFPNGGVVGSTNTVLTNTAPPNMQQQPPSLTLSPPLVNGGYPSAIQQFSQKDSKQGSGAGDQQLNN